MMSCRPYCTTTRILGPIPDSALKATPPPRISRSARGPWIRGGYMPAASARTEPTARRRAALQRSCRCMAYRASIVETGHLRTGSGYRISLASGRDQRAGRTSGRSPVHRLTPRTSGIDGPRPYGQTPVDGLRAVDTGQHGSVAAAGAGLPPPPDRSIPEIRRAVTTPPLEPERSTVPPILRGRRQPPPHRSDHHPLSDLALVGAITPWSSNETQQQLLTYRQQSAAPQPDEMPSRFDRIGDRSPTSLFRTR